MALLELHNVSKSFMLPKGSLNVLKEVSFNVEDGEFIALVGPSGCGKSTLLRVINGIIPLTSGQVLYRDKQVDGINLECAPVFQSFALLPWLTVKANVEMGLEPRGIALEEAVELADRVIVLAANPGRVVADLKVELPRPRDRRSEPFNALTDKIFSL